MIVGIWDHVILWCSFLLMEIARAPEVTEKLYRIMLHQVSKRGRKSTWQQNWMGIVV